MDDFEDSISKIKNQGGKAPQRMVSITEYKVLEKMAAEGKLTMDGYPKSAYFDEYVKLMREAKEAQSGK